MSNRLSDRPQPVLGGLTVAAIILAVLHSLLDRYNLDGQAWDWVRTGLDLGLPVVAAWWASRKVTPLSNPQDDEGNPLRPVNSRPGL